MNLELAIAIVYLACATLLFIVAVLIFREDSRKRINRITALMFGFAACGPLFYGLGTFAVDVLVQRSAIYNLVYIWELFFPQLVFFALVFPSETKFYSRFPRLKYAIFVPHLFHLVLTTVFADPDRLIKMIDPKQMGTIGKAIFEPVEPIVVLVATMFSALLDSHIQLFSTVNFVYVIVAATILYYGAKRVTAPQLRKQVIIVINGISAALAFYVIAFILPDLGIIDLSLGWRNSVTILALMVGCGSIVWAIIRYRFMDVRLIVRQSLVYTITSALVVGAYLLIVRQLESIVQYVFGYSVPGLDIVFIIIALILFQPVMSQIDDLIRKLFIRDKADYRNISQTFSRTVASVFSLDEVFSLAQAVLQSQLLFEKSHIFTVTGAEADRIQCVSVAGAGGSRDVNAEKPLVDELIRRSGVNNIDELIGQFPQSKLLLQLASERIRFLIPLLSGDEFLGCIAVSDKVTGYRLNYEDVTTLTTIADQLALAITTSRLYRESLEKQRMEEEMNIARSIQQQLLPRQFPSGPDYEFTAYSDPSLQVGGDYFDFIKTPRDTYAIVIADASGKGMPAALLISQIQAAIRTEVRHNVPLAGMLCSVNELIEQQEFSDNFATLFFAEFDPLAKVLRYSNAGHNYPIVISERSGLLALDKGGLLLGVFRDATYEQAEVQLEKNDIVLFYTDGLNEAVNERDEQYGETRAVKLIENNRHLSAVELQQLIINDVRTYAARFDERDDMTLIILKIIG